MLVFYEHSGRGGLESHFSLGTSGGASTLTQQLAKLFTEKDLNFLELQK
jgi:membrane peptidoglycan carboxypeptidase